MWNASEGLGMATDLLMPSLSPTMEAGTLRKWLVEVGHSVASGDVIAEIETDKAVMEFEAPGRRRDRSPDRP